MHSSQGHPCLSLKWKYFDFFGAIHTSAATAESSFSVKCMANGHFMVVILTLYYKYNIFIFFKRLQNVKGSILHHSPNPGGLIQYYAAQFPSFYCEATAYSWNLILIHCRPAIVIIPVNVWHLIHCRPATVIIPVNVWQLVARNIL